MVKDREAWHAAVRGVTQSMTWPSDWTTKELLIHAVQQSKPVRAEVWEFPGGPVVKNTPANAGDLDLILGLGRFHMPHGN